MATATIFNTLDVTRRLKGAGFTEQQAEGIADTLAKDALAELVTKTDLVEEIRKLEITLTIRMGVMWAAGLAGLAAYLKH